MTIFLCDDTMEGIFTAVYDAWASRLGHANVKLQVRGGTMELFADYRETETDAIYRVLVLALPEGRKRKGADILAQIQNPSVCLVMELSRSVWHETHRYMGFIRFHELQSGVLFSEIAPENQVLPLLGAHFADRFPREHFLIFDHTHCDILAHEADGPWWIIKDVPVENKKFEAGAISGQEAEFQRMWRGFCSSVSIKERENPQLQRQLWPYKFRKWMTEGQKDW